MPSGSYISTHDLTRRSTGSHVCTGATPAFQLTTSQGGRLSCSQVCTLPNMYFNSRPHEEVDKFLIANAEKKKGFQLTTSRRGRRGIAPMWKAHDSVSTHDLTKRSTHHLSNTDHIDRVSTHDLSKRSTVGTIGRKTAVAFQLTTSRRGRPYNTEIW